MEKSAKYMNKTILGQTVKEEATSDVGNVRHFLFNCIQRCSCCDEMQETTKMTIVLNLEDRLIILISLVLIDRISIRHAKLRFWQWQENPICISHLKNASSILFEVMGITETDTNWYIRWNRIERIKQIIDSMLGKIYTLEDIREMLNEFFTKHRKPAPVKSENQAQMMFSPLEMKCVVAEDEKATEEKPKFINLPKSRQREKSPILPKELRQPRKQKLVSDDDPFITIYKHRVASKTLGSKTSIQSEMRNPKKCCLCNNVSEAREMTKVPKLRFSTLNYLGPNFRENFASTVKPYMCRAHFDVTAFNESGRLLRNAKPLPLFEQIVYKIEGDNFIKVEPNDDLSQN